MTIHSIGDKYGLVFTRFMHFPAPFIMHYLLINLPIKKIDEFTKFPISEPDPPWLCKLPISEVINHVS